MYEKEILEKVKELPDDLKKEVLNYIKKLMKHKRKKVDNFKFDWEGGLEELKDKFTSVELQHKSSKWR